MSIRSTALRQFCRYSVHCVFINLVLAASAQSSDAAEQLTVREYAGAVKLKMEERWQDPEVGMAVVLPATVSTGEDGSIKLEQDGTVYSVASSTALELFAGPKPGQLVQRVVQSKGSAFYDVSKREHRKLHVETPYLVAVIKGTQFNVTVEAESASIALFEGLLQIEAPDTGEIIELEAGFIARRHEGDAGIAVIRMDDGEPVTGRRLESAPTTSGSNHTAVASADENGDTIDVIVRGGTTDGGTTDNGPPGGQPGGSLLGDDGPGSSGFPSSPVPADDSEDELRADLDLDESGISIAGDIGSEPGHLSLEATSDLGVGLDAGVDAGLGSGDLGVDLGADAGIGDLGVGLEAGVDADLGSGDLGVDLSADVGVGDLDAGLDGGIDADLGSGDLGVDLGVDAGVGDLDAGLDAGLDADLGTGDLGADIGADVGIGDLDADLDAGVDADLASGDLGVDLGADVGAGDLDAGLDAGVDADLASGDLGADLGADVGAGDLNAGLDAGVDADLGSGDLGVDLGADVGAGDLDVGLDAGVDADLGSGDVAVDAGVGDVGVGVGDGGLDVGLDLGGLGDSLGLNDLLGGEDTGAGNTEEEEEEEEIVPLLPDLGNLLGL